MATRISGDWFADGRTHWGVGIEDTFVPQERPGHRKLDLYELTQHYENWRDDLALAAGCGAELIRWGIPWYMTERSDGVFDFSWMDEVAAEMSRLGLRPVIDLMHYGTPLWLKNGFINPRYPDLVARYAGRIAERYAGVFDDFTPLNEPMINAIWCGMDGKWPPYLTGHSGFVTVLVPLVEGLQRTCEAIKAANPAATVVHVDAGFLWRGEFGAGRDQVFLDEWRFLAIDMALGRVTAGHPLWKYLVCSGASPDRLDAISCQAITPDVLGINYYPAFTAQGRQPGASSDHPVEAGTQGLTDLVTAYHQRYGIPLAITETSRIAEEPPDKIAWTDDLVRTVAELKSDGVFIAAVFWFPLLDMYDWEYRFVTTPLDAHRQRFGLVDLVRGPDNRLARVPNAAYDHFRDVTRQGGRQR